MAERSGTGGRRGKVQTADGCGVPASQVAGLCVEPRLAGCGERSRGPNLNHSLSLALATGRPSLRRAGCCGKPQPGSTRSRGLGGWCIPGDSGGDCVGRRTVGVQLALSVGIGQCAGAVCDARIGSAGRRLVLGTSSVISFGPAPPRRHDS